ncbi:PAS domain S-box protein [Geobacter sp. AOG2]|uniref:PAS domain S-box protein n=1 Tax=Geobacter sp. AOG2 TaxID=1566347 RepID=UPI001CC75B24|nr:transporter substrate-binding domain-containing protein [Geobacter sp. AOG2]GFE59426.1 hypothetical protein AOG2_00140 [Geobacter sp. AOG2]
MRSCKNFCHILYLPIISLAVLLCFVASAVGNPTSTVPLTDAELQWLKNHPRITLAPDPDFKPIEFFDKNGAYQGAAADIIRILEKKLGVTITVVHLKNWDAAMAKFKNHEVDMLGAMVRTPNREKFALFTDTLVTVPGGIFARKGSRADLTLKDLKGKRVAVVSNYAAHDVLKEKYPDIILDVVPDVSTGLAKASLGMVDAYVENMANATYYAQEAGITNLQLVGKTDFDYRWGIGIRKDWPELQGIINKGLAAISDVERQHAINGWVHVENMRWQPGKAFIIGCLAAIFGFLLLIIVAWNFSLRGTVRRRTASLNRELDERRKAELALKTMADGLEGLVRDRTAELERQIRERIKSERLFRELFENIADPIYISDLSGKIIAVNNQACQELGYAHDELLALHISDLDTTFTAPEAVSGTLRDVTENGTSFFESVHRRKDASRLPVELHVRLIDFNGQAAVMGVARNISERKQSEQALKDSEENYRCFAGLTSDYVHRCSRTGTSPFRIQWMGGSVSAICGYSIEEIFEQGCWLPLVHPDDRQSVASYLFSLAPGDVKQIEFRMVTKGGNIRWISETSRCEAGEKEGELVLFGAATDFTDRKNAEDERDNLERQILHAQKLESLGVLAGGIAHDFNNILMAIMGNADLALMRISKESPCIENLRKIEDAAARAADLARQMLAYSGKGKFVVDQIDLNALLEEMLHMLEVSISKKAVLRLNLTPNLPTIEADATQMRQIVMNLVINASEAIGDKSGVIAITTGCMDCDGNYLKNVWLNENIAEGLYVYLEIADAGCGMDAQTIAKIFDPFFTTKFTGRGLGMAAVLGIVRGHKGAIKVYSEVGKGTTFKVLLPASGKPAELFSHGGHDVDWSGSGTVLLVDDEETVRGVGKEMLHELGFATITANDGREALEIFRNNPGIAFVILDLTMPHVDGEECFRELRRINPDVKVIMSSGFNEHEVTQKFVGKGLAGFIQKPYKLSVLKTVIQGI